MKVLVTAVLLILSAAAAFCGPTPSCRVCEQPIAGEFFFVKDKARGGKFEVCTNCIKLESRCFSCSLPVKSGFTTLTDGRFLCARCAKDTVRDDEETKRVCWETRESLDRLFARFLSFPQTNVVVTVVDRFTLDSLFKSPGYGQPCASVFGATRTHPLGEKRFVHTINILSGLNKPRLEAVVAHEFAHTWLNENLAPARKAALSRDALEAFCELVAYDLMLEQNDKIELNTLKENPYTAGQLDAFLAAESHHGFNAIVEWIKSGESEKLDATDPEGVRVLQAGTTETTAPVHYISAPPRPLPETLKLKSISGTGARRLAIINDQTFAVKERGRVRLASTNLLVECLEIRTNSVLIQIKDTGEKQELLLPDD